MNSPRLPPSVSGEGLEFSGPGTGRLSAYAAGEGAPLPLVRSINAAASAAEMMTDAIHAMTAEIRRRCGDGPIDALALSLSSEFLARSAVEAPAAFHSLALVSPTGFEGGRDRSGAPGTTLARPWL